METAKKLFDDLARLVQTFKVPAAKVESLLEGRRKDLEALLEVGRIAQGGAQSLAEKQADMLRASLEGLRNVLSGAGKLAGGRLEAVRVEAEKAIANVAELAHIALKSQSEAFDAVKRRAEENIQELKALVSKSTDSK